MVKAIILLLRTTSFLIFHKVKSTLPYSFSSFLIIAFFIMSSPSLIPLEIYHVAMHRRTLVGPKLCLGLIEQLPSRRDYLSS